MSTSERARGDAAAAKRPEAVAPASPAGADPYGSWMEKMQRGRGRHSAITRNLYNFASYKNWAEKMKGSFDEPEEK